jgi:hypothetical protein
MKNKGLVVMLDGKSIDFKFVNVTPSLGKDALKSLSIEVGLWDGSVINDNGSRVEVIVNYDKGDL